MEYGITFPRDGIVDEPSPLTFLTEFAREAEQMGCAYGVIGDRLESGIDPLVAFAAIAGVSGQMRLVTSVVILPPRGILVTAKQFASVDVLTGGRVIAGVGTGSLYRDYQIVGMDPADMWPRFEDGVQAMRAYLTPGAPPHTGPFNDTTGVQVEPYPVQRPPGALTGIVTNALTGLPLPGAVVQVDGSGESATAGSNGRFVLNHVGSGARTL